MTCGRFEASGLRDPLTKGRSAAPAGPTDEAGRAAGTGPAAIPGSLEVEVSSTKTVQLRWETIPRLQ